MLRTLKTIGVLAAALGLASLLAACGGSTNAKATKPLPAEIKAQLTSLRSSPAEAMMIRIFKETSELEVWKRTADGSFRLFKTYEICAWSGELGPKLAEGDRQAPEGFYTITPALMNPNSSYYLSFNTGFPNKFDRAHGRTGSHLMIHGSCSSSGCYSMTDESIAEIYALVRESFAGGNRAVQLQIFPFRMTADAMAARQSSPHAAFWRNLKTGYDYFDVAKRPVSWDVCGGQYVFDAAAMDGQPLDALAACPPLRRDETLLAAVNARSGGSGSDGIVTASTGPTPAPVAQPLPAPLVQP